MMSELRHLVLVAEHGTFTAAARHAHLSQPALTASIRRLEEALGARLLFRGRRGASLTPAGAALLPRAKLALAAVEEGRRAIAELEGLEAGEVRIGAGSTACTHDLPAHIAAFRRRHPKVRFVLREVTPVAAVDLLEAGEIDLAIVTHHRGERWIDDPLVLIAAPGTATRGAPFITFMPGAATRTLLERHFPRADVVMELGSIEAVKGNVRAGIGIALVSRRAVEAELARGLLVEVKDKKTPIVRTLRILHRGLDRLSPAAAAFRRALISR
jgi:DNA-binding transcriptional LysR family regulator